MEKSLDIPITASSMVRFALPTIGAQVFMSIYSMIDSLFVANLVGTDALSAVNIVMPALMIIMAISTMLGQGGRALVSAQLGAGETLVARQNFSLVTAVSFVSSAILAVLGLVFLNPLLGILGANDQVLQLCREYAVPLFTIIPLAMLGMVFDTFFIAEGRPGVGSGLSVAGGITNIVLDWLFIAVLDWGVAGAAWATGIGYSISAVGGLVYFAFHRTGHLFLVRPVFRGRALLKMSTNGASEMVMMLSGSVVNIVMNNIMIRLAGADGVAAIAVVVYAESLLTALYYGYDYGVSALASYNFGKGDTENLRAYFRINMRITILAGVVISVASFALAWPLTAIFARPDTNVFNMAVGGFRIVAISFLFMGVNDFASSFFTALNDGKSSGIIAFIRTFVLSLATLVVFSALWGVAGVWAALPAAEALSLIVSVGFLVRKRKVFNYA